jgi:Fe-Mn family superoxide dismutase
MRNIDWKATELRTQNAQKVSPPPKLVQAEFGDTPSVSVEEVEEMLKSGQRVQVIDARPRHYITKTTDIMEGAVWRDPERIEEWIGQLSKDEPVVTFCVYGFHIGCQTATELRQQGFDAKYMTGGHYGWKANKGPVNAFDLGKSSDMAAAESKKNSAASRVSPDRPAGLGAAHVCSGGHESF